MITRYEIKFRINHQQKVAFLDAARFGLEEDPHGDNACYRVTSVYFDAPELDFYWEKVEGIAIRTKLRLRYYGELTPGQGLGDRPCFLELKHRIKDCVYKDRVRLTPGGAQKILEDNDNLRYLERFAIDPSPNDLKAIETMRRLHAAKLLRGTNTISYFREAWIGSVDNRLRITFDQMARTLNPELFDHAGPHTGLPIIPPAHYILEVKFNEAFPRWVRDIVADQQLYPRRFSKYAAGIETLHSNRVRSRSHIWALESGVGTSDPTADEEAAEIVESMPAELPVGV